MTAVQELLAIPSAHARSVTALIRDVLTGHWWPPASAFPDPLVARDAGLGSPRPFRLMRPGTERC